MVSRTETLPDSADELVKSLAEHFLSGELSTELLRHGTDEEITRALIAVRGIGQVCQLRMSSCI